MPCKQRSNYVKTSVFGGRVALFFGLLPAFFTVWTFAAEFPDGPILGNPAEKFFADAPLPPNSRPTARFTDNEIPPIRQTSGEVPSIWDNPQPKTAAETPITDWGTAPTLAAPAVSHPPPTNATVPAFTPQTEPTMGMPDPQHGFGIAPNWGQINPYANPMAGTDPQAYYTQNPYINPYFGSGYYDPNYTNPYASDGYNAFGHHSGYHDPMMLMMAQQSQYNALLQEFNERFPSAEEISRTVKTSGKDEAEDPKPGSEWTMQRLMPLKVSSPLGETLLHCAKIISPFNTPTGPDKGCGQPLMMRNWQDRPCYFGGFVGWISGSQLVSGMIDQGNGANGGLKFGYYFNNYWGVESRLHFASIDIRETEYGRQVYDEWYEATFPGLPYRPLTTRSNQLATFDVSVQYYPLGNAKWRPFVTYGLGVTRETFVDTFGNRNRINALSMPIGVGLRYWWNEQLAIQADIVDNVVFASGQAKTQGNFAFTVGVSYAFGTNKQRRPTSYWPHPPSMGSRW